MLNDDDMPGLLGYYASGGPWRTGSILDAYLQPRAQPVRVAARRDGPVDGTTASINNPGAVFDDRDAAAQDALSQINPISKQQNTEYMFGLYSDPVTGKIGYTDPVATGAKGKENFTLGYPGTPIGMGHTHANYMDEFGNVTTSDKDQNDSDNFSSRQMSGSPGDLDFMRANNQPGWGYYLGTPSGKFLKWTHQNGVETLPDD